MRKEIKVLITLVTLSMFSCENNIEDKGFAIKENYFMSEQELNEVILETPKMLTPANYVTWVKEPKNGLQKEKEINDLVFSLLYQPAEYIICQDLKKENISSAELKKELEARSELEYYHLRIGAKDYNGELLKYDLGNGHEYTERVDYYAFKFEKDITLVAGTDTVSCSIFHYERTFDVAPYSSFLLAFKIPAKDKGKDRTIVIDDKIFNKGTVKFFFSEKRINTLPKLEVEEIKNFHN